VNYIQKIIKRIKINAKPRLPVTMLGPWPDFGGIRDADAHLASG